MNRYRNGYDRTGGRFPRGGNVSPYRRAPIRNGAGTQGVSRPGGCGCGPGNGYRRDAAANHAPDAPVCSTAPATPAKTSCGCASVHGRKLMDRIRAVDFALYETVLYLDVYPHSCDALETYRKLKAQSEALHAEYEAAHGPLTAFGNRGNSWEWMSKPFPWEYDAE